MDDKQFEVLRSELDDVKKLLALLLKHFGVKGDVIANALGISESRLSQMIPMKKYKKSRKKD